MALKICDTIGDYSVVELLGSGGMGYLYHVRTLLTDREAALKVLLPDPRSAP